MKTRILLTVLMIGMILFTYAQKNTITLTFTAESHGQHVTLDSILIENLTQNCDTSLYAPDTVLVLDYITGIRANGTKGGNVLAVSQNYPNPMDGKTTVNLNLSERKNVLISISDIMGQELLFHEYYLDRGNHSFTFYPGSEHLYFLTARTDQFSQTIKMFNLATHAHGSGNNKLEYDGQRNGFAEYKSGYALNNFLFNYGDQLRFSAYTPLGVRTIIDNPTENQTYTIQYLSGGGTPCPGMPTVSDIDGNIYNTVLIGNQCWMKENLKVTNYKNGTAIPNEMDVIHWINLTSGAYVWYDDDAFWGNKYGALYNWYTTVDTNGLCPTGWHVPTDGELTQLVDYMVTLGFPNQGAPYGAGSALKSCRQVNSPLGDSCQTDEHPRWNLGGSGIWSGFDEFGFSGLPGGDRNFYGSFFNIGLYGKWWSSTEYSSVESWCQSLGYFSSIANIYYNDKRNGFCVRCLRDK